MPRKSLTKKFLYTANVLPYMALTPLQPVQFDAAGMATQQQLNTFLNAASDEYRAHVQRDFLHLNYEA
eukprot:4335073-Amphidinium_carterae.1